MMPCPTTNRTNRTSPPLLPPCRPTWVLLEGAMTAEKWLLTLPLTDQRKSLVVEGQEEPVPLKDGTVLMLLLDDAAIGAAGADALSRLGLVRFV